MNDSKKVGGAMEKQDEWSKEGEVNILSDQKNASV